jgi:hypothetical protein
MTGGLLQLSAHGAQDIYLTGNPQITFFTAVYRRHTNFAIQSIPQYFTGDADFGKKVYCQIDRIGDLINQVFLRIQLPSLEKYTYTNNDNNLVEFFWVNSIGHALIKIIDIEIGGVVIDRQYGLWMEIWSNLTVPLNKREGFNSMIGKSENPINLDNNLEQDLYIPLYFWFCKNIGLSLPLIAIQSQEVRFNVTFRKYQELIISSTGSLIGDEPSLKETLEIKNAFFDIDYIFLEDDERKIFAKNNHQYLIEQLQVYATSLTTTGLRKDPTDPTKMIRVPDSIQNVSLNFNNPVKELFWVIQNTSVLTVYPYGGNEWFNFSTQSYKNGNMNGTDTMINGKILFEGQELFDTKEAKYFRTIVPFQRHTNIPNNYIYLYSFCTTPEEFQPSGSCNFSRIDSQVLYLEISNQLIDPIITVFAKNYNILNVAGGMVGIEYSN